MFCLLALLVGPRAENAFEGAWAVVGKLHSCTAKHPCAWQEFGAAKRLRDLSIDAQELVQAQWKKAVLANNTEQIKQWRAELEDAEAKVAKAQAKVEKAEQKYDAERLKEEEAKVSAAPAQAAGGVQLLLWLLVCSIPHGRRAFRAFLFFGVMLCSSKDQLVVKFHFVGWQHFGERVELSEQRAVGCFRFHANLVALRVLLMLLNLLSVLGSRWGGSACFPLALRSPGCGCFCLRLDVQVTSSVRGKSRDLGF